MATLKFNGAEVLRLIQHTRAAKEHTSSYGIAKPEPGLFLVKDNGIYLMSNATTPCPGSDSDHYFVAYAKGYEPGPKDNDEKWEAQYEKIRAAVGGDDFCEFVPITSFADTFTASDQLVIKLTKRAITVEVWRAPAPQQIANISGGRPSRKKTA